MASTPPCKQFLLEVRFESREDGGLRAFCEKVPNFFLSHSNPESVRADVQPALETILTGMFGVDVRVTRLCDLAEALDEQLPIPAAHLCGVPERYVGMKKAA